MGIFRRKTEPAEIVRSAGTRFETRQPGITTWHDFSAGSHYDPQNVGYGPLVGLDEHLLEPGAGFDTHPHRGVEILTWVLEGTLRHEDDGGRVEVVGPAAVLHQSTGSGVRHSEVNASATEPLRFVQLTVLGETGTPRCTVTEPPVQVPGAGLLAVLTGKTELELPSAYLHVTRGSFNITRMLLQPGDSVTLARTMSLSGDGELLLWSTGAPVEPPDATGVPASDASGDDGSGAAAASPVAPVPGVRVGRRHGRV